MTNPFAIASYLFTGPERARAKPRWWARLGSGCSSQECRHRQKLWPTRQGSASGIFFDGNWYCASDCVEPIIELRIRHLLAGFWAQRTKAHRLPLGLVLMEQSVINAAQLRSVLQLQRQSGFGRIGDWLLREKMISEQQLTAALAHQCGCPIFPLSQQTPAISSRTLLPFRLLESALAVPAHLSADGSLMHVAFGERTDPTLLYAIEQMLGCRTVPCMALQSTIHQHLGYFRQSERPEVSFDTVRTPRDITSIICSYAQELAATGLSIVRAPAHIWVRFHRLEFHRDLLFRILPERSPSLGNSTESNTPKGFPFSADTRKDGVSDAALPV